jgi:hypothetical protein
MNYYAFESANGKAVANGGNINFKVNISDTGRFLVLFIINHMGADSISSATGFWRFTITDPNGNEVTVNDRKLTCLTIPHVWDASASTLAQIYINNTGQHTFKAENSTGTATNGQWASTFSVRIYRLKAG